MPVRSPASRRQFLQLSGFSALAAAFGSAVANPSPVWAAPRFSANPFTLGVASGEPLPDGVVLWTRLAPDPLRLDGTGGMPEMQVPVSWQVSEDPSMRKVVRAGAAHAQPQLGHSVHVEVGGLRPDRQYYYRFRAGETLSPIGRTRTAAAPGAALNSFSFAFASCQNYPAGFYTAHKHMSQEDLDLVVFLGDYIYEGGGQGTIGRGWAPAKEATTLADYRVRHAQVKTDADLQASHGAFPWLVTFDDHEVDNNWAGEDSDPNTPVDQFLVRRAEAFQAYYENMPLRLAQRPEGSKLSLHRRRTFGDLVDFYMLDTRQYRDDQTGSESGRLDPARTILGNEQEDWLRKSLAGPTARWNTLAQQVVFSQRDFQVGPEQGLNEDSWDNYPVARDRMSAYFAELGAGKNPVIVTGDVHMNYVCDIRTDFNNPAAPVVGTELVGTSITSGGDDTGNPAGDARQLEENPHIRFINRERGYVRNTITPSEWTADFRVVDYVTRPGAPVRTRASFVIEEGKPGAEPSL
ncbi:alkaline phosphatase D family protein [Arthrobacter sp.]|uniref:alkaline phosphatase D family protein n=1 Tax=Arthrobacter sp. TaxID=1667 RepID=UPI00281162C8|nr:alkaline phosphatase D family protein [Arthrobacter sp.]